jgi:hypothetical protein
MARRDPQAAAIRHRVARVQRQVHDHLVELRRVDPHAPARLLQREVELHAAAEQPAQHRADGGHRLVQLHHARLQRLLACEGEQLAHQRRARVRRCP